MGDSVFVTFSDKLPQSETRVRKAYWVANGTIQEMPFNVLADIPICAVTLFNRKVVYSYITKNANDQSMQFLYTDSSGKMLGTSANKFTLHGELLAMQFKQDVLTVITYDKFDIDLLQFAGDSLIGQRRYHLLFDLSKYDKYSAGLMSSEHLFHIPSGSGRLKAYLQANEIAFSLDQPFVNNASKTSVLKVDLTTGKNELFDVGAPDNEQFCSYYCNNKLYRFIMSPSQFQVAEYDLFGNMLHQKTFLRDKSLLNHRIYNRESETRKIQYGTLFHMMQGSRDWEPSILVESQDDSIQLAIGTFYDFKKKGGPVALGHPLGMLGYYLLSKAYYSFRESPGICEYFYLKGTVDQGFESTSTITRSCQQLIDEYEIDRNTNVQKSIDRWYLYLLYKGYANLHDGALGIYQEKRGRDRKLILLKYPSR